MNFHLKLNNEKLESLNGQLAYVKEALSQHDIKEWEAKEFEFVKSEVEKEITETKALIERIKLLA